MSGLHSHFPASPWTVRLVLQTRFISEGGSTVNNNSQRLLTDLLAALALPAHLEGVEVVRPGLEVPGLEVLNALSLPPGGAGVTLTESLERAK